MPTLHSIHRCGVVTHVALPREYNISGLDSKATGSKQKTYSLTPTTRRKIKSSLQKLWYEKTNRITFWTYTFSNINDVGSITRDQKLLNTFFSSLLENFKKTYGLTRYVWVSERTEAGTIHYHCAFDIPKLEKSKFMDSVKYFRESFRNYCAKHGVVLTEGVQYCSIGFPRRRDNNGVYRGSVVRSAEALANYIAGYLCKKCDRTETGGRIYAISRNCIEKPVKRMDFQIQSGLIHKHTHEFEYCSVDYFQLSKGYDDFFLKQREESLLDVETESDIYRIQKAQHRKDVRKLRKNAEDFKIYKEIRAEYINSCKIKSISQYNDRMSEYNKRNPFIKKSLGIKLCNSGRKKGNFYTEIWKV